ncbi:MAG: EscI/YscI/HrpB family type III secretion system inner rod protein [Burkholderiaceae bacterium]|jgi:hypothetical protein
MQSVASIGSGISEISFAQKTGGATVTTPSDNDVEDFNRILTGVDNMKSSATPIADPALSKPLESTAMDAAKAGLQNASDMYSMRMARLDALAKLANQSNSISQMMTFQVESMKMSVEMDLTGKVITKAVQDIEQLTRQQ